MKDTEQQSNIIDIAKNKKSSYLRVNAFAGTGKDQPYSEPVLTPTGWVTMGDLTIDSLVMTQTGKPATLSGIFEQGIKPIYKIEFADGTYTRCGIDHLWKVFNEHSNKLEVLSLHDIITKGISRKILDKRTNKQYTRYNFAIPLTDGVEFNGSEVKIHPYLLGVLLGDGGFTNGNIRLTNSNATVIEKINQLLSYTGDYLNPIANTTNEYYIQNKIKYKTSNLKKALIDYNLYGELSINKHIPREYLYNSLDIRNELYQGLVDTDGHKSSSSHIEYSTSSSKLAFDFIELSRSLGYYVTYKTRRPIYKYKDKSLTGELSYRIYINSKKYKRIVNVSNIGEENSRCISVNNADGLYITKDYIVTHNTTTLEKLTKTCPDKTFLYLVFNKAMAEEAKKRFGDNTKVSTINGLAYAYTRDELNIYNVRQNYKVVEIKQHFNISDYNVALMIIRLFDAFCNSAYKDINEKVINDLIDENEELSIIMHQKNPSLKMIINGVLGMWNDIYNKKLDVVHSFYLKYFHLAIDRLKEKINYNYVLLDECLIGNHYVHTDNGKVKIKSLYKKFINKETLPLAKSFNIETNEYEYKPIIWSKKSENREIFLVQSEGLNKLKCTSNEIILTQRGYVKISDIIIGQDMMILDDPKNHNGDYIKSIEYIGNEDVYDIEVEDNHNFITSLSYDSTGIIVHNCQDTNSITLDIFNSLGGTKIIVGDKWQQIYGFRGTVNAMDKFINAHDQLYLSRTFRFNDEIAQKANYILNNILGEPESIISHFPNKTGEVKSICHITRTNAGVISLFSNFTADGKVVKTVRNPDDIFRLPLSLFYFLSDRNKNKSKIEVKWLFNFRGRNDILEYAQESNDIEMLTSLRIVDEYWENLIAIYEQAKANRRKKKCDILLTTAHTCKGLEWDEVFINDDFPDLIQRISFVAKTMEDFQRQIKDKSGVSATGIQKVIEEFNLFYVAITRATLKVHISLPNSNIFGLTHDAIDSMLIEHRATKGK